MAQFIKYCLNLNPLIHLLTTIYRKSVNGHNDSFWLFGFHSVSRHCLHFEHLLRNAHFLEISLILDIFFIFKNIFN